MDSGEKVFTFCTESDEQINAKLLLSDIWNWYVFMRKSALAKGAKCGLNSALAGEIQNLSARLTGKKI